MAEGAQIVLRDFNDIGKYKVRLVQSPKGAALDIREYANGPNYQGFTRRGVRLLWPKQAQQLQQILEEALAREGAPPSADRK